MTQLVDVQEANARLAALLVAVEAGEEVIIARGGRPVARLVAMQDGSRREMGFVGYRVPDSFFEPLPEDELAAWKQ
ncbi:type II toxin-antitoxin system Phd/YefM family antitoxin [Microlunatus parietis]|uniref:Antitoxin n=1 Tax=Microlunatus parietis TaxID=682979 RepID=A0A7Y9LDA3_9ACTN|nr:type II toxin-antitoxin system prevent-host-death family antitoxin [Microlunatus parietis]NYE72688.1 prevent-host-death family protein [Microlunatus parietis]